MSPARPPENRRVLTWAAALAAPALVGAAVLVPIAANGAVDLPDLSPRELIEFAAASDVDALSGTIEQSSELGLPDLGALTGASGGESDDGPASADIDDVISLVTGSHTAKVYLDGERARLQVLDRLAERNVYVDGAAGEVWYVDSETRTATKIVLPGDDEIGPPTSAPDSAEQTLPTPDEMLDEALARLDDSTEVAVGTDARVAGRDVYELVLTPRTSDTLVGEVRFAIDGETGVALAASVTARGASAPAFEIAFTRIDFSAPDAAVFAFDPGEDIAVTEKDISAPIVSDRTGAAPDGATDAASPVVIGEGWSRVFELPAPSGSAGADVLSGLDPEQLAMLESVTIAVDGGRVLQTSLLSVLLTDDGRVLVGAVPAARLVEAAQSAR